MLHYLSLLSTVQFALAALRDQEDICPSAMRTRNCGGGGGWQFLKVGTGSLLPTWGQSLWQDSHPNRPASAASVPPPIGDVVWAGAVLIIQISAGTFGAHKAVQNYSRFQAPATTFCIVIQDSACPRGWHGTHVPGQSCWEAQAFCPPSPPGTVNQSVQYFLLQKSRSWLLIHKNAVSPCSVSEATFLCHLAPQTGGSLVSYMQGRLYEKFICCTC